MSKYPDSTWRIVGYKSPSHQFSYDDAVDWACDMLVAGFESENLLMLAAITKPTDNFECEKYLVAALSELGLPIFEGEKAIIASIWHRIKKISLREDVWSSLSEIYLLLKRVGPDDIFYDFTLLYWAKEELNDMGCQFYWDREMTRENAEDIVVDYTKKWMEEHKSLIDDVLRLDDLN